MTTPNKIHVADSIIGIAKERGMRLFKTPMGDTYARFPVNEHEEVHRINSNGFKNWLRSLYFEQQGHGIGKEPMEQIKDTLEAEAAHAGKVEEVFVRVGFSDGRLYLDLGDAKWRVVEISEDGWKVLKHSPVNFRRPNGIKPLPGPERNGSIEELKPFIGNPTEDEFKLTVAWLLGAFHPTGPFPILVFIGPAGIGKTTRARILASLIDPRDPATIVGTPNQESVMLRKKNSRVIVLDNMSHVPNWLSDLIATTSTGGGMAKRKLYADDDETLLNGMNPQIITSINEALTQTDALSRSILVHPTPIARRKKESTLYAEFDAKRPRILGALLDAVSEALSSYQQLELDDLSRMADFETWVTAAEPALGWEPGTFRRAYASNRESGDELAIEASPVGTALIRYLDAIKEPCEENTPENWLRELSQYVDERVQRGNAWPKTGLGFTNALNRIAPSLKSLDVSISKKPRKAQARPVEICKHNDDTYDDDDDSDFIAS